MIKVKGTSYTPAPTEVVQRQLDAYNARDIDLFMSLFSDGIEMFELGDPRPACAGKSEVRERYTELFEMSPRLRAHLVSRTALGRAVVDHERIEGRMGSNEPVELLMIYEMWGCLIRRTHVVRVEPLQDC